MYRIINISTLKQLQLRKNTDNLPFGINEIYRFSGRRLIAIYFVTSCQQYLAQKGGYLLPPIFTVDC